MDMTEAAESLIAQLYSQGKLTKPRRKNRRIRHENKILKVSESTPDVWKLQVYQMTPKTYQKSYDTIPLGIEVNTVSLCIRVQFC
jgi:hypothetical protein